MVSVYVSQGGIIIFNIFTLLLAATYAFSLCFLINGNRPKRSFYFIWFSVFWFYILHMVMFIGGGISRSLAISVLLGIALTAMWYELDVIRRYKCLDKLTISQSIHIVWNSKQGFLQLLGIVIIAYIPYAVLCEILYIILDRFKCVSMTCHIIWWIACLVGASIFGITSAALLDYMLDYDRPENRIYKLMLYGIEERLYGQSYITDNGHAPERVYRKNIRYTHDIDQDCGICMNPFNQNEYRNECILYCGHRYHHDCLRIWEKSQLEHMWNRGQIGYYKCPYCIQPYVYKLKWKFDANVWHNYQSAS